MALYHYDEFIQLLSPEKGQTGLCNDISNVLDMYKEAINDSGESRETVCMSSVTTGSIHGIVTTVLGSKYFHALVNKLKLRFVGQTHNESMAPSLYGDFLDFAKELCELIDIYNVNTVSTREMSIKLREHLNAKKTAYALLTYLSKSLTDEKIQDAGSKSSEFVTRIIAVTANPDDHNATPTKPMNTGMNM